MLKLDRLELSGFKSFVDPVTVRFAGGVTGIVGPNGCGKSNLSDAITWVLGEQSAKSMRGETMEDVIFNGSEKRKPLGMGEVSVTFSAPVGFAGSEDGKITIARRVFRSGESQYRLNGKLVRLKDVKDLLMDTGLGVRAYSVIEQGKIGQILSGKPQERRRLLEEAAGITRYKARKKIAEVKLEETTANLLRLDDIVSEVERNLRTLKRQAGAARRFQERQAELKKVERAVYHGRWSALAGQLSGARIELGQAQTAESELAADLHRAEAALAARREEVEQFAEQLGLRARRQAELGATIEGRQQYLAGARRTIAEIEARRSAGSALALSLEQQIASHAAALAELGGNRERLVADHDRAAETVSADGAALRGAERRATEAETRLEELRRDLLASLGLLNDVRTRLHREQVESEKGSYRERHLLDELAGRESELGDARAALTASESRVAELTDERSRREQELTDCRSELDALLAGEAAISDELRALETDRAARAERQRLLADLADSDLDREAALAERLAAAGLADAARLRDRAHAWRGWEQSLDQYLGSWLDAVLVPAEQSALELAAAIAGHGRAAGTLLSPVDPAFAPSGRPDDPAIVAAVGEALGLDPALAAALPPAYLVESAEDAVRLARAHTGVAFLSRQRLWAEGGLLHLEGAEAQPGYLARASELEELAAALPLLGAAIDRARQTLDSTVAERAQRAESVRRLDVERAAVAQELAVASSRREELDSRCARLAEGAAHLLREHTSIAGELTRIASVRESLGREIEQLERRHAGSEQAFDAAQTEVDEIRRERENVRALSAGRRGQLDVLTERLRSLEQQTARLEREHDAARQQVDAWAIDSAALDERQRELEAGMERAETELQEALELRLGGEEALRADQEKLDSDRQAVRSADSQLGAVRERHTASRGAVEELRIRLTGLDHDAHHLAGELRERCGEEPPEIPAAPIGNLLELEADLARLRQQVEQIGPVNVLAAEESTAEEERHAFLTAQRADVVRSVESLRQTIREINLTSSARFKETFSQVNEQFAKTFVELFRGGEAEMRLMDEEDILECGIEIVARPPGKRLQNLMLLSGGEKALTAIALLFALFRIKPSPFCILDEVDAPLDDVNTLRYVGMLRQLAKDTQCIVITHNKLTMEVAATLYGVTMEERGVSKLIEVELEEVQPEAQSA